MHYKSLLTVYLPEITPDPEWEKEIMDKIASIQSQPQKKEVFPFMRNLIIGDLKNISTAFGRELTPVIHKAMERYNYNTEDERYLKFEDRTDEYLKMYNENINCIKLPNGLILEENNYRFWDKFIIKGGQVYEKYAGPLHHPKRTKKSKKMQALLDYSRKKLYKSFDDFVETYCCGILNEKTGKYGEWYNPDGTYDWYSVGGRWPQMFLVKNDCSEYSVGERRDFAENTDDAPEGYRWVVCARKKDIQWDAMRQWRNQQATESFEKLEAMFKLGIIDESVHAINEKGILVWGKLVYRKGETLEEYLSQHGIPDDWRYPISVHDIFNENEYYSETDNAVYDEETKSWKVVGWQEVLDEYIDNADDNIVFVGIDYHI